LQFGLPPTNKYRRFTITSGPHISTINQILILVREGVWELFLSSNPVRAGSVGN